VLPLDAGTFFGCGARGAILFFSVLSLVFASFLVDALPLAEGAGVAESFLDKGAGVAEGFLAEGAGVTEGFLGGGRFVMPNDWEVSGRARCGELSGRRFVAGTWFDDMVGLPESDGLLLESDITNLLVILRFVLVFVCAVEEAVRRRGRSAITYLSCWPLCFLKCFVLG
jgi:hypothetical protein